YLESRSDFDWGGVVGRRRSAGWQDLLLHYAYRRFGILQSDRSRREQVDSPECRRLARHELQFADFPRRGAFPRRPDGREDHRLFRRNKSDRRTTGGQHNADGSFEYGWELGYDISVAEFSV